MKHCLIIFVLLAFTSLNAKSKLLYQITKQVYVKTIPKGMIHIKGKVIYDVEPAKDVFGKITSHDLKNITIVKRDGSFEIEMNKSGKKLFFYQEGCREVFINFENLGDANYFELEIYGRRTLPPIMVEKPVIYLYSDDRIETEIRLNPVGQLAFSYPKYNDFWRVQVNEDGNIINLKTNLTHPYLFWEASQYHLEYDCDKQKMAGFFIHTDTVVNFLESNLKAMGLNGRESTDFITYWAPRLMQKKYATIQFVLNEVYTEKFGDISFSKKPDVLLRVGMLYSLTNEGTTKLEMERQFFKSIKRKGFTVIEWGGAMLQQPQLTL